MKYISIIIDKDFLKQKHIDNNNEWVGEEDIDKKYWVAESTDDFNIEEIYFDRGTGDFKISVFTEGCFVSLTIKFLTWINASTVVDFGKLFSEWECKAKSNIDLLYEVR